MIRTTDRIGEIHISNSGSKVEIIEYFGALNSTIKIDTSNSSDVKIKQTINPEHNENWFKRNVKYIYYALGYWFFLWFFQMDFTII